MSELENAIENEEVTEVKDPVEMPKVNAFEAKARQKGWLSADELKEKKGDDFDPDNVVSARQFVEKGEMISAINQLKKQVRDNDGRLADNNAFWQSQLEVQKDELLSKRDEAIDLADKDEVKKIDIQLKDIEKQEGNLKPTAPQFDPADIQAENNYLASLTNRSQKLFAQDTANQYINQGYAGADLVDAIKLDMDKEFPAKNPRREEATLTTSKSRSKPSGDKATVDNLGDMDRKIISAMRNSNSKYAKKSDGDMLKIIEDSKR